MTLNISSYNLPTTVNSLTLWVTCLNMTIASNQNLAIVLWDKTVKYIQCSLLHPPEKKNT